MAIDNDHLQQLIDKLKDLPLQRVHEVEDFVEFLRQKEQGRNLTAAAMQMSERSFAGVWDNPEDAVYDAL